MATRETWLKRNAKIKSQPLKTKIKSKSKQKTSSELLY